MMDKTFFKKNLFSLAFIGLVSGILLNSLASHTTGWYTILSNSILMNAIFLMFVWPGHFNKSSWQILLTTLFIALLVGGAAGQHHRPYTTADELRIFSLLYLGAYTLNIYNIAWYQQPSQSSWQFNYTYLYQQGWNTGFNLLFAASFCMMVFGLLWIWSAFFDMISISIFSKVFLSETFSNIFWLAFFGVGLAIARYYQSFATNARKMLFAICFFLMPVFALFNICFLLCLPTTHVTASLPAFLFTNLAILGIGFFNMVFKEGQTFRVYPHILHYLVLISFITMPLLPLLGLTVLWRQFHAYGLSPNLFIDFVIALLAFFYACGYAITLTLSTRFQQDFFQAVNKAMSVILILSIFLISYKILDPYNLSTSDQTARLFNHHIASSAEHPAYLHGANLQDKNLSHAQLAFADLTNANLRNANLSQADLQHAVLEYANLSNANLQGAIFDGANLLHAQGLVQKQLLDACGNLVRLPSGLTMKPCYVYKPKNK